MYWWNESAPNSHAILGVVVLFEAVIHAADQVFDRLEEMDNKQSETKIDEAHKIAKSLSEDRSLSDQQKTAWKLALSPFAPQPFRVLQIGFSADYESANFSRQIGAALADCGWVGEVYTGIATADPRRIFSGIAIHAGIESGDKWNPRLSEAIGELLNQIRTCGIAEGGGMIPMALIEKGMIGIAVGQKP